MDMPRNNTVVDRSSDDAPRPAAPFGPVDISKRIASVDVMRGVALLGILVINIIVFALPGMTLKNPLVAGGFHGADFVTWLVSYLLFYHKFMPVFSMLFGAGLVLMSDRAEASGRPLWRVYYRRILWLLVFGLAHGYLLWVGDILYSYAICGLLLYPLRRLSGRKLIVISLIVYLIGVPMIIGSGIYFVSLKGEVAEMKSVLERGGTLTERQERMRGRWEEMRSNFDPTPEEVSSEIEIYRDGYWGIVKHRAPRALMMQTMVMLFLVLWRVGGLMILGMGLMKLGVFSAGRSLRFYVTCILAGYGIGLLIVAFGASRLIENNFDFIYLFGSGGLYNYGGGVLVALGHIGVVMIVCKSGLLRELKKRLAAVGRMALTNYLMHTVICTAIFFGYGLGLFGKIGRFGLMGFVLGIWILQLMVSPIWLRYFRFGPMEWLWRTLTYGFKQPIRLKGR